MLLNSNSKINSEFQFNYHLDHLYQNALLIKLNYEDWLVFMKYISKLFDSY